MRRFLSLIFIFVLLCGCRTVTRYVPMERTEVRVEHEKVDTSAIYSYIRSLFLSQSERTSRIDSLIDHVKETVTLNEQGDTTRHYRERHTYSTSAREKELERELAEKTDYITQLVKEMMSVKSDTIREPYPVEVPVEVERHRTWWETVLMWAGGFLLLALVGCAAVWWIKRRM